MKNVYRLILAAVVGFSLVFAVIPARAQSGSYGMVNAGSQIFSGSSEYVYQTYTGNHLSSTPVALVLVGSACSGTWCSSPYMDILGMDGSIWHGGEWNALHNGTFCFADTGNEAACDVFFPGSEHVGPMTFGTVTSGGAFSEQFRVDVGPGSASISLGVYVIYDGVSTPTPTATSTITPSPTPTLLPGQWTGGCVIVDYRDAPTATPTPFGRPTATASPTGVPTVTPWATRPPTEMVSTLRYHFDHSSEGWDAVGKAGWTNEFGFTSGSMYFGNEFSSSPYDMHFEEGYILLVIDHSWDWVVNGVVFVAAPPAEATVFLTVFSYGTWRMEGGGEYVGWGNTSRPEPIVINRDTGRWLEFSIPVGRPVGDAVLLDGEAIRIQVDYGRLDRASAPSFSSFRAYVDDVYFTDGSYGSSRRCNDKGEPEPVGGFPPPSDWTATPTPTLTPGVGGPFPTITGTPSPTSALYTPGVPTITATPFATASATRTGTPVPTLTPGPSATSGPTPTAGPGGGVALPSQGTEVAVIDGGFTLPCIEDIACGEISGGGTPQCFGFESFSVDVSAVPVILRRIFDPSAPINQVHYVQGVVICLRPYVLSELNLLGVDLSMFVWLLVTAVPILGAVNMIRNARK